MSNCHTCHWSDRDPKSGEQVIHREPNFLDPTIKPGGAVPDIRIVKSCGRGAHYYKTYGANDHDCKKYEDAKVAEAQEAEVIAEKHKKWKHPTSRAKLPKNGNMLELIEVMAEGHGKASDILFDVMGHYFEKLSSFIKNLDDMNIRGKQIPIALEYVDGVLLDLIDLADERDEGLVDHVNETYANVDKETAVQRDASKYGHGPAKRRRPPPVPKVVGFKKLKKLKQKHGKIAEVKPDPHAG